MRLLDRYLARQVVLGCLLALFALVALDAVLGFIRETTAGGRGDYGAVQALLYVFYTLPRRMHDYFPTAMLLGGLLGLGALAGNSELTAMRAAGVSVNRIARAVLGAGVLLMVLAFLLGEFAAPLTERRAETMKIQAQNQGVARLAGGGLWFRQGNAFLHIDEVLPDLRVRGVQMWVLDEDGVSISRTLKADEAHYLNEQGGWLLRGVLEVSWGSTGVTRVRERERLVENLLSPQLFRVLALEPERMSARELARYIDYLTRNDLDTARYRLAFWTRFTTPLSGLVMLMVALPFVFASRRSGGFGQQLFIGIVIGVLFFLLNRMLNHVGLVYRLPPVLAAFAPLSLFAVLAVIGLRRVR